MVEWCVRSWVEIRMVHWSMRNGPRVADGLYIKRVLFGVGGFPFLLSLLVLLYSKASCDFETIPTLVLSWLPWNEPRALCPAFDKILFVTNITYARPRPLHCPTIPVTTGHLSQSFKQCRSDDNLLVNETKRAAATPHIGSAAKCIKCMPSQIRIRKR